MIVELFSFLRSLAADSIREVSPTTAGHSLKILLPERTFGETLIQIFFMLTIILN